MHECIVLLSYFQCNLKKEEPALLFSIPSRKFLSRPHMYVLVFPQLLNLHSLKKGKLGLNSLAFAIRKL